MKDENKQRINRRRLYRTALGRFFGSIRERFDLGEDSATQAEVVASITKSVEFRGTNLWVLICATFIASLGLNVNSTAVIIGAMLVSPLMGPIMGIGLSLGINDFQLLKKSLRNFLWMFVVSIVTSSVFFLFSPYSSAQSELLARTSPTTYDVLIAFFGGLAGMLAQTRRDRTGTVISGVAIATALMPPLCTAGFGIAFAALHFRCALPVSDQCGLHCRGLLSGGGFPEVREERGDRPGGQQADEPLCAECRHHRAGAQHRDDLQYFPQNPVRGQRGSFRE